MAASPSTTRARRADARLLHHVLDALPRFGAPPQKKILVAGGLTRRSAQDRWHSFVGDLKPEQIQDRWENQIIGRIPDRSSATSTLATPESTRERSPAIRFAPQRASSQLWAPMH